MKPIGKTKIIFHKNQYLSPPNLCYHNVSSNIFVQLYNYDFHFGNTAMLIIRSKQFFLNLQK